MHRSKPRSFPCAAAVLVALVILTLAATASARPTIRQSFFNAYPTAVGSRLDNLPSHATHCGVCHFDFNGGGARNPFGVRLGNVIGSYPNNDAGRQQAIHAIENEDSDGDGYAQLVEITSTTYANAPTFPGLTPGNVGSASNVPQLSEISGYLVPATGADVTPPTISVLTPDGGESWTGGTARAITWTANDNVGVAAVDLYYRDAEAAPWTPLAIGLANSGTWTWFVHNTPTAATRVRAVARDAAGNSTSDQSATLFTIVATPGGVAPTTLRDFHQPGTQPLSGSSFQDHNSCASCHGGYDPAVEPARNFRGSMMAQAARDPLFFACLAIAEQDAPGSGDLCLRCHTPFGWLSGRSQPTSGAGLTALDRDGVSCDFCHSAVNPVYQAGVSPPEDQPILDGLLPAHLPANHANGQYVVDPQTRRRGPFADAVAPHAFLPSPFHRTSEFCGTCHDVSNPVFHRVSGPDYAPGPLDQKATSFLSTDLLPLERTYSEWKNSAYPAGVYAPEFAGNRPDGIVSTCQDCHMRDVSGTGCNDPAAPTRPDLPLHDMTGGNAWLPSIIGALYPGETDPAALAAAATRATAMLQKAATLGVTVQPEAEGFRALVTVTNRTGHKLPTGYPEGRRMWLHVVGRDDQDAVVYESGAWNPGTGVLTHDADATIYEIEIGLSPSFAQALGLTAGPSFHFALNDSVYRDNRIPPLGFTNAAFASFGGQPLDPSHPAPRYPDGQNWDRPGYLLPLSARTVTATLYYQTTSKEFVEFLRDANVTNTAGQQMYDLWVANGRAAPVAMATASANFGPVAVEHGVGKALDARAANNPFRGALELLVTLPRLERVTLEVFDPAGRLVSRLDRGILESGTHSLTWDGRDRTGADAGSGLFWATVRTEHETRVVRVARLR